MKTIYCDKCHPEAGQCLTCPNRPEKGQKKPALKARRKRKLTVPSVSEVKEIFAKKVFLDLERKLKLSLPDAWRSEQIFYSKNFLKAHGIYQKSRTPFPAVKVIQEWLPKGRPPAVDAAFKHFTDVEEGDIERSLSEIDRLSEAIKFRLYLIEKKGHSFIGKTAPRDWPKLDLLRRMADSWRVHMKTEPTRGNKKFKGTVMLCFKALGFHLSESRIQQLIREDRQLIREYRQEILSEIRDNDALNKVIDDHPVMKKIRKLSYLSR